MFPCPNCNHSIAKNIENKCLYCGVMLEEKYHISPTEKSLILAKQSRSINKHKILQNSRFGETRRDIVADTLNDKIGDRLELAKKILENNLDSLDPEDFQ